MDPKKYLLSFLPIIFKDLTMAEFCYAERIFLIFAIAKYPANLLLQNILLSVKSQSIVGRLIWKFAYRL